MKWGLERGGEHAGSSLIRAVLARVFLPKEITNFCGMNVKGPGTEFCCLPNLI